MKLLRRGPLQRMTRLCSTSTTSTTSTTSDQVRVRFAPSPTELSFSIGAFWLDKIYWVRNNRPPLYLPTGSLHLGGLRTALYNWLFARANEGTFILRIEDTDQTRLVPGASAELEQVLDWAGLSPDEGPGMGGPSGPYVQSERLHLYTKYVDQLMESGHAYRCFCTNRRLELMKREAARTKQGNKYDRKCFHLREEEVEERLLAGQPHTIRFLLTPHPEPWTDIVYGTLCIHFCHFCYFTSASCSFYLQQDELT